MLTMVENAKPSPVTPAPSQQEVQDPEAKHGPGYDNDTSGWVRGMGNQSPHPHFDRNHRSGSK